MRILPALATIILASPALAAPWKIDPASTLSFTGKQADAEFTGRFTKFLPVVEFDSAKPQDAHITVTVDMASATIDDRDKQDSLPTEDWFNSAKFPTATFTSTAVKASGSSTYTADGNLTLLGTTKPVQLEFTFLPNSKGATVDGTTTINRKDFNVGQGEWKSDEWIAYPVAVKFHLIATKE